MSEIPSPNSSTKPVSQYHGNKQVPINHKVPPDLPLQFSDGLSVQFRDGLFFVSFFQSRYPVATTTEQVEGIAEIEARCVAQLVMTLAQMKRNLDVLNGSFKSTEDLIKSIVEVGNASTASEI